MRKTIVGVLIGLMLMTSFLTAAYPVDLPSNQRSDGVDTVLFDDDVPVWEIGDSWTYKIDDINVDVEEDNQSIHIHLEIEELPLTVVDDAGDSYTLDFEAEVSGTFDFGFDLGDGPIVITAVLESTPVTGDVTIAKSNLGIKAVNAYMVGRLLVNIIEQPYIELPFSLPEIPVPGEIDVAVDFSNPFALLDFPLNTSKVWNLAYTNCSVDGSIQSIWFKIINFINIIADLLSIELLPPELSDLLPVLDIGDLLVLIYGTNVFEIPEVPFAFACSSMDNITVEAGTYSAYNISIVGGLAQCYYAPEVGNVAKLYGDFTELLPYIQELNMELVDTNYA
jgi:hypothetical protein